MFQVNAPQRTAIDSALGNPNWEEAAGDGRFDVPDDEDDR
jgi:hypothetical protein